MPSSFLCSLLIRSFIENPFKIQLMKTRRDFLTNAALGAGTLAMPHSIFAATGNTGAPKRFVFIRKSNGIRPNELALPTFSADEKTLDDKKQALEIDLDKHELPAWLQPIAGHKADLSILQGLSCKMSENGHWSYSSVMGAYKSGRNSLSGIKRATIDFELAKLSPSPFGHVELSLTGNYSQFRTGIVAGYSASGPHQRNYCYADPQTAYNELFKSLTNSGAVDSDNAMLEFLQGEEDIKPRCYAATKSSSSAITSIPFNRFATGTRSWRRCPMRSPCTFQQSILFTPTVV